MTSLSLLPAVLALLCSNILCSLGCDLTQGLQKDFSLLNQMSTSSLVPCLKEWTNFSFPKEALDGSQLQKENATVVVLEMVQQIFNLFSQNAMPATWNQTQVIELRIGLDHQLGQLESCLGQDAEWEVPSLGSENPMMALKSYFQGISRYLQGKGYSRCAWEFTRIEIRRCILFMSNLTRKFKD
ncbi:interferon alpha-16-like [Monodelphis domestica]|uniref:Interferon alpha-16-like n=1 Tax=Monodelphis domestica TaxID=13616 RepID=F7GHL9_MONDO|nr:interferon alpha-16-like [Monodelphis domestica]